MPVSARLEPPPGEWALARRSERWGARSPGPLLLPRWRGDAKPILPLPKRAQRPARRAMPSPWGPALREVSPVRGAVPLRRAGALQALAQGLAGFPAIHEQAPGPAGAAPCAASVRRSDGQLVSASAGSRRGRASAQARWRSRAAAARHRPPVRRLRHLGWVRAGAGNSRHPARWQHAARAQAPMARRGAAQPWSSPSLVSSRPCPWLFA